MIYKTLEICPLCNSSASKIIANTSDKKIIMCKICDNAWTHPLPDIYDYKNNDFHSDATESQVSQIMDIENLPSQWKKSIYQQVRHLKRSIHKNAKILEIGCGEGLLLNELFKAGYNVTGIEPSTTASERARKKGLNVITGEFPNTNLDKKYDVIILSHVLEHLQDPGLIIQEIKKVGAGGMLFLVQANYKGIIPTIEKDRWYAWMPNQHFWHFTPTGLRNFVKFYGLKLLDVENSTLVHPKKWWWVQILGKFYGGFLDQFHILFIIPDAKK